jgi:formate dehydrogenase major subunit
MRLTVDDVPVTVPEGSSILDATRAAGQDIPTLCHDDRLTPAGTCRVCLVHTDRQGIVAACATPAAEGMAIHTDHVQATTMARQSLELTVARLPASALDLPTELAAVCDRMGVTTAGTGKGWGRDDSHPYLRLDRDLCIACGRCVRMCDDVQGTFALTLAGRGADTVVAPGPGTWAESDCVSCGGCADTCPTGAISGPMQALAGTEVVQTTCGYCGVGCTLDVHIGPGGISHITPGRTGPVNRGHACVKGRFAHAYITSPDRLTTPLIRRDGTLQPASWDEALTLIADRLGTIIREHGPDAVAAISSARATNEENYLMQKLMRVAIGTNNIDNCSRICHAPSAAGLTAAFGYSGGTHSADDIDAADCFLLAGANPTEAHPVIGARIKQRVLAGAKLIVIDPRKTELARLADIHLRCAPGSNVAVFNALARLMLEHGWYDNTFVGRAPAVSPNCVRFSPKPRSSGRPGSAASTSPICLRRPGCTARPRPRRSFTAWASPSTRTVPTACARWPISPSSRARSARAMAVA